VLALAAVPAFLPVLGNGFVNWDDPANFLKNPSFRGLGPPQLRWAWTTFWLGVYQPLAWMLFGLQYAAFGLRPWGYHLTSLLLHAAVVAALYAVTVALLERARLGPDRRAIRLATVIAVAWFAVHPLRVEVVAWASCQPYLPCALGYLLAILAYLRAHPEGGPTRPAWLAASIVAFAAALLFKAVAVSLPVVLLVLDVYPLRRPDRGWRRWAEKLPFVLIALAFMAVAMAAKQRARTLVGLADHGPSARLAQSAYGACFYLEKTVWPAGIAAYYPAPTKFAWSMPFVLRAAALVTITAVLLAGRRRRPGLLAAWVAFLAILAPTLGLAKIGRQIAADRYSYVASFALVVALAAGLAGLAVRWRRIALAGALVASGVLAASTWMQCRVWRDSHSLWSHALAHGGGGDPTVEGNLGLALCDRNRPREGLAHLAEAVRLEPDSPLGQYNLGVALFRSGRVPEAVARYEEALRLDPDHAEARHNLGQALARLGRVREASEQLARVVRLRPDWADAHRDLGALLAEQGRFDEASTQFAAALALDGNSARDHQALGLALAECGRLSEAADHLAASARLRPGSAETHYSLGVILAELGRRDEAVRRFREALRLRPGHAEARRALTLALRGQSPGGAGHVRAGTTARAPRAEDVAR
jgi:Flp pilus assembly protein TadD